MLAYFTVVVVVFSGTAVVVFLGVEVFPHFGIFVVGFSGVAVVVFLGVDVLAY